MVPDVKQAEMQDKPLRSEANLHKRITFCLCPWKTFVLACWPAFLALKPDQIGLDKGGFSNQPQPVSMPRT